MEYKHRICGANIWLAITLIAIGTLFLLDNLGVVDIGTFWEYWPVILIAVGIAKLVGSGYRDRGSAFTLISIGALFLLFNLNILEWGDIWLFWPVILIIIGISIILGRYKNRSASTSADKTESLDRMDAVAIFGGSERIITSQNFEGGNVTAIFGGTKLDFGKAKLASGGGMLDIFTMFGGVEIYVPEDWNLVMKGVPIFGGFEDSRRKLSSEELAKNKTLIIKGLVLFGGVHIKNA
jgi:predicted membrane protein